jgi:hypothetical protein
MSLVDDAVNLLVEVTGIFPVDATGGFDHFVFSDIGNRQIHTLLHAMGRWLRRLFQLFELTIFDVLTLGIEPF